MEGLLGLPKRVGHPVVAVQRLIAEIFKKPRVKLAVAALGVDGDDSAGVAPMIRGQYATLHAKFADGVGSRDGAIDGVELRVLQLIAIHADACAVHLAAGDSVGIAAGRPRVLRFSWGSYVIILLYRTCEVLDWSMEMMGASSPVTITDCSTA